MFNSESLILIFEALVGGSLSPSHLKSVLSLKATYYILLTVT